MHHSSDYSSVPQDSLVLEHYGINELNFESVKKYREKFSAIHPSHPWNGLEMKEFLYKIGAWGKVRNTNEEGLTLAGLIMFSEERIITEVLPQYFLEYRESLKETLTEDWSKRFTSQDGTWSGNLFDFYFKASADLTADFGNLYLNSGSTQVDETAALACLHESLINAIVHANYHGEGGIVIEKEKHLLRFSNPGLFRISVEQALEGNISNLRNPNLFKMFILIGLCKRTGSGLKGVKTMWESYGDDAFDVIQDSESARTMITLHVKPSVLGEEDMGDMIEQDVLSFHEEDRSAAAKFDDTDNSYNSEMNSYNNQKDSISNEKSENNSINSNDYSFNKESNSCSKGVNSMNKEADSYNKEADSTVPSPNSYNNGRLMTNNKEADLTMEYAEEASKEEARESSTTETEDALWEISALARKKKRLPPDVMEEIVMGLCALRPLMLRELASLLERTPDGLRNNYLAKLVDQGKIRLKYPDQINHPRQAYMIANDQEK
ncbi:transcriptional regulator [Sporosarcina sp. HYO08]|nr:transcriptional regulator [Sporosarcina sp. HYO08]